MPQAIAAVVVEFFVLEEIAATIATFAVEAAVSYAITAAASAALGGGSSGESGTAAVRSQNTTIRQSAPTRRLIFGEVKTGGYLAFAGQTDDGRAHLVVALGDGELESVDPVFWLADDLSSDAKFNGLLTTTFYSGTLTQSTDAQLIADFPDEWSASAQGKGVAYCITRYKFNANAFPRGLVLPAYKVKGLKLFDPRTNTTVWSANPALAALHIVRSRYGYNAAEKWLDMPSFIAAANICDEQNVYADALQKRYAINGVFEVSAGVTRIIEAIENACGGKLIFTGGKYRFYAGAYRAPTTPALTEVYLRDSVTMRTHPNRQQRLNIARGTYREPKQDWQTVDFAPQIESGAALLEDGEIVQNYSYPATTHGATAQRLARMTMRKARASVPLSLKCNWAALRYQLYDVIPVTIPEIGLENATYLIAEYKIQSSGGVDMILVPERADFYAWNPAIDEQGVATVVAPSFGQTPPAIAGLMVDGIARDLEFAVFPTLTAVWTSSNFAFFKHYEVQYKKSALSEYGASAIVTSPSFLTAGLELGDYDLRVRVVGTDDQYGVWSTELNTSVSGDNSPPAIPTNLSVIGVGTHAISWRNPEDNDFKKANIYINAVNNTSGAILLQSVVGLPDTSYNITNTPGGTRYYWVTAQDRTGNESTFEYAGTAT